MLIALTALAELDRNGPVKDLCRHGFNMCGENSRHCHESLLNEEIIEYIYCYDWLTQATPTSGWCKTDTFGLCMIVEHLHNHNINTGSMDLAVLALGIPYKAARNHLYIKIDGRWVAKETKRIGYVLPPKASA